MLTSPRERPRRRRGQVGTGAWSGRDGQVPWDVIVIGGGNAALVAAITARERGASVLLLERAPKEVRGGNTRHTRNVRCLHDEPDAFSSGSYMYEELWSDLGGVGSGPSNPGLASITIRASETIPAWMTAHRVRWQEPLRGTLQLGRTNRFFLGGGKALLNTYYRAFEVAGGVIRYDATVTDFIVSGDVCRGVITENGPVHAHAVVCACGGYEANIDWLRRYWGDAALNYVIRGPIYNDGLVLQALYDHGSAPAGEEKGFHAIAVDARAPRYDGGIATRLDTIPFGIVVNRNAQRFYDEGEDIWPKRYASWGTHIAAQPDQIAYSIWDDQRSHLFLPPMYPPAVATSIADLAAQLELDPQALEATVSGFNRAVDRSTAFDPTKLDGLHTEGISPPKTNWALPVERPPFYGVAMRPGITFTYRGVAVDSEARVERIDGEPFKNVFAAGEIMAGNILSSGYLAGFGLTIGTVWGRIAGEAVCHVRH